MVKDLAKNVGPKAVSRLTRNFGRKVGKETVGTLLTRAANASLGPEAQQPSSKTANDWGEKEDAGDRIREILEANPLERKKTSLSKKQDERTPKAWPLAREERRAKPRVGHAQGVSDKANEAISRLLADDD